MPPLGFTKGGIFKPRGACQFSSGPCFSHIYTYNTVYCIIFHTQILNMFCYQMVTGNIILDLYIWTHLRRIIPRSQKLGGH